MTEAEELATLSARMSATQVKHAKKTLDSILKSNPHLYITLLKTSRAMGYDAGGEREPPISHKLTY
jgi:hypothetical protein